MDSRLLIHPLSPHRLPDFLTFFDGDAFVDNPHWASCYCHFYLADHRQVPWELRSAEENRAAVSQRIAAGRMQGYLGYLDGRVVAWCHAAPRLAIPNLQEDEQLQVDDLDQVGAIVCFLVAPAYRRAGIAASLLGTACAGLSQQGLAIAEAYPRINTQSDAANYHGPLQMFLEAGFETYREYPDFLIVRKQLN
jgi:ribosomal protein S18 acetylase RimI-like enzyme